MKTLTVRRANPSLAPAMLAAAHPGGAAARDEMRALYERCLAHYRSEIADAHTEFDDIGAAAAHFVAANLQALRDVRFPPAAMSSLQRQLAVLLHSAGWSRADELERQVRFEKLAIVAVLVRESAAQAVLQGPTAIANVRRAAHRYLAGLLGLDADHITVDARGLVLRRKAA